MGAAQTLDDILRSYNALPEEDQHKILEAAHQLRDGRRWLPNPGPQTEAYFSEADELFYGGGAGGGKSALLCGVAVNEHKNALLLRRISKNLKGVKRELHGILGSYDGFNDQAGVWRHGNGVIDLGHCEHEGDKENYQGVPHDLKGFDEITQFTESQYTYIIGWNRSADPKQRCRVIATGNPPTTAEGGWVIKRWAAWLDKTHPNPAKPGELRWYTTVDGEDVEVANDYVGPKGEKPRSRTFIPALLEDNPDLAETGYASVIEAMPEPLRTMMREGRFDVATTDDPWQVIPTMWVQAAMARWTDTPPEDVPMTAVAADVAQGGADKTQIQARYGWWYSRFDSYRGNETPDGPSVAALIVKKMRDRCRVVVDAGGGYGGDTLTQLAHSDIDCFGFKGGSASGSTTRDGLYRFKNLRAQTAWQFREALDPTYGSRIALPPDPELLADLCAYRFEIRASGRGEEIVVLPKEDMKEALGRSPDKGDTTIMLHASSLGGLKRPKAAQERREEKRRSFRAVTAQSALKDKLRGKKR
ncbi:terminase [Neorhizobium sp. SOG26]|uniref:terminase family protein n=1 Tax=Neorhizobium sp. SOG26 TaxID=2060726 RepID=UPI000E58F0E7|nr:terminase family protein [Neorhizobium sp. SOG26]AXV15112.1 terminase [Neorhizobium sp. SOG26]